MTWERKRLKNWKKSWRDLWITHCVLSGWLHSSYTAQIDIVSKKIASWHAFLKLFGPPSYFIHKCYPYLGLLLHDLCMMMSTYSYQVFLFVTYACLHCKWSSRSFSWLFLMLLDYLDSFNLICFIFPFSKGLKAIRPNYGQEISKEFFLKLHCPKSKRNFFERFLS